MKNILSELPQSILSGRLRFTTEKFVDKKDIVGNKVLNIGCGFGWFEIWAINHNVTCITGMEIDNESLKAAKNIKDSRVKLVVGSAIKLPFRKNFFDTVVSWEVLEHIPKGTEELMFKEVIRVLKPQGRFYLSTPNKTFWSCVLDPAWWLIGHRHYSLRQIEQYAHSCGISVKNTELRGAWWEIIGMLNLYFSKWVLRRNPLFENIFESKKNEEYKSQGWSNVFVKMIKN